MRGRLHQVVEVEDVSSVREAPSGLEAREARPEECGCLHWHSEVRIRRVLAVLTSAW